MSVESIASYVCLHVCLRAHVYVRACGMICGFGSPQPPRQRGGRAHKHDDNVACTAGGSCFSLIVPDLVCRRSACLLDTYLFYCT